MTGTSAAPPPEPLLDLPRLLSGIRWRRRRWMSLAVLGLLGGALLVVLAPPAPTAVTRLLIVHEDDNASNSQSLLETELALLETTRTAAAALDRLGSDERPEDFLKDYTGTILTGNVLELTVHGSDDQDAVRRAQALADTVIADHIGRIEAAAVAESQAYLDRRDRAEAELAEVDEAIAAATGSSTGDSDVGVDVLYAQRADLLSQLQQLGQQAEAVSIGAPRVAAGTMIVDAPRPVENSLPRMGVMYAVVGLVLGLGAGLALAAVSSVVQDRPVLRRDIAAHLGASVIAQVPAPQRGPARLWRRSRAVAERRRVAATLARIIREHPEPVALLELGSARATAALAREIAAELAAAGAQRNPGVGSVEPGTAWLDLPRLGSQALLVVRAGHADTAWLHTVARQLAELDIRVIGVVLVHPDPRDRTDGTLWDALHTARRQSAVRPAQPPRHGPPAAPAAGPPTAPPHAPPNTPPHAPHTAEVP